MKSTKGKTQQWLRLLVGAMFFAFAICISAQVKTETTTASGQATHEVTVERGEVVLVRGNDLFVKMDDGTMRHFPNVPESARATVGGQKLGIHDLRPGMKLERTITVSTTPKTVTTVQTVTGKVWHINPPSNVVLTLEDGTNQQFKIPQNQKFNVDGQETDAWGLKKGMKVSATKIVEVPEVHVTRTQQVSGKLPPPPSPVAPPPADMPVLIAVAGPAPVLAAPAELPKTGSMLPLIGLLGALSCVSSIGLGVIRKCL
jgi:LPXTG-motif cell wall-anchored protein